MLLPVFTTTRYAEFFQNQEEPELLPNEVAGRLAKLLGLDHYPVHLALLTLNPLVGIQGELPVLTGEGLAEAAIWLSKNPA